MNKLYFLLACFMLGNLSVHAGGYKVSLQGQKQQGLAHASTGLYLDASSIFFNPGAMMHHGEAYQFVLGANMLFGVPEYQNVHTGTYTMVEKQASTPANFYAAYRLDKQWVLGLGVYTPFGSGLSWGNDWEGRAMITSISMRTFFIQPTVSYQINDKWGVGAGLIIANGSVNLQKAIPGLSSSLELEGKADVALGYNVGLYFQANEKWSFGLNYRSELKAVVEAGDAHFQQATSLDHLISPEDQFSAELPMVFSLNFGTSYRLNEKWLFSFDLNYDGWASYEELDIQFDNNSALNAPIKKDFKNTLIWRFGTQYALCEKMQVRGGYYYDPSPVNMDYFSVETPSLNNHGFTLGASLDLGKGFGLDLSLLWAYGQESSVRNLANNFEGSFISNVYNVGLGFSYNF